MVSRMLRRSGIGLVSLTEFLEWEADSIYQVGVGIHAEDIAVMLEVWNNHEIYVEGVEPNPESLANLKRNQAFPGKLHEMALSNYNGKTMLYYNQRHKDGSSVYKPYTFGNIPNRDKAVEVDVIRMDDLWPMGPKGNHPLLWIDVEGHELAVLEGGERFIESVEMVNVEVTSKARGEGWADPVKVHEWLKDHGFYRQWHHTQRANVGQVDAVYVRPWMFKMKYCCCPCEQKRFCGG